MTRPFCLAVLAALAGAVSGCYPVRRADPPRSPQGFAAK
jgi:hypothetical protein